MCHSFSTKKIPGSGARTDITGIPYVYRATIRRYMQYCITGHSKDVVQLYSQSNVQSVLAEQRTELGGSIAHSIKITNSKKPSST